MIILDARAVMHHCYHIGTDPEAILSDLGNDINTAQFGFNNFMERYMLPILEMDSPTDIVICHDDGIEYRETLYPEYKKTKSRTDRDPEERIQQEQMFSAMKKFWAAIGCTQAKVKGVEADDLIAYFCQKIDEPIDVYTVDVDLMQLQGQHDNVNVLLKCEVQESGEHKGILYKYTSIAKSMLGDTSDNYGGVKGFGPSKWGALVEEFGYDGVDELLTCVDTNNYALIEEVLAEGTNKPLQLLYDQREQWRLSWKLAQLHPELCWKPKGKKLTNIQWYKEVPSALAIASVLRKMDCQDLITHPDIDKILPVTWGVTNEDIDLDFFKEFEQEVKKSPFVTFDYETYPSATAQTKDPKGRDYLDVKEALIAGASFTFGEASNLTFYIPTNHKDTDNCSLDNVKKLIKICEDNSRLIAHNVFFETAVTKTNLDFWLKPLMDTRLMSSYVDENESGGLKSLSEQHLHFKQTSYKDTVWLESEERMRTMDELTLDEVLQYGCDDAIVTAHLNVLFSLILKLEGTYQFLEDYESCSQHPLVDAYLQGTPIDWDALETQHRKDDKTIEVNTARLKELLFENCGTVSQGRCKDYINACKDFTIKSAKAKAKIKIGDRPDGFSAEEVEEISKAQSEAMSSLKVSALEATEYIPYEEEVINPVFIPTIKKFLEVTTSLGFDENIISVSLKGISEYVREASFIDMDSESEGEGAENTKEQSEFLELLIGASKQLKVREGEEYDSLVKFCEPLLTSGHKVVSKGDELNMGSPKQMQQLLYCKLGFPVRMTGMVAKGSGRHLLGVKDGSPSTDSLMMDTALAEDTQEGDWRIDAVGCIKSIKESETRISLYHKSYPVWKHETDDRIHPQIKNCGTVTRRPSGTNPNILQVSKHQQDGVMRSIFLPHKEDHVIVSIDFSQQELRIMASESEDDNLMSCYMGDNQRDVHSMTASGIAGVEYGDYLAAYNDKDSTYHKEYVNIRKRPAKATNFLFAYMGQANTLSQRLIIPYEKADEMMNATYATYPKVVPWQESIVKFAERHGYSKTAYGNRRHINNSIFSKDNSERKRMQRQAVNAVIQGGAADILKIVLTNTWKTNLWSDTKATLIAPVYDEITASVPKSSVVEFINRLVEIMEITPPNHKVGMKADVSLGKNWRDQIEIGLNPSEEAILNAVAESEA